MRVALACVALLTLALSESGCSSCDDRGDFGATVILIDESTSEPVCDATVSVHQTGDVIAATLPDGRCTGFVHVGLPGRDYTVTVDAPGYKPRTVEVPSVRRACHHDGGEVTVKMNSSP